LNRLIGFIGVLLIIATVIFSVLAFLIEKYDSQTGITYDGLGRRLTQSPLFAREILGEEKKWAGFKWFLFDSFSVILGVVVGGSLAKRWKMDVH
jgi:hypothetical protein